MRSGLFILLFCSLSASAEQRTFLISQFGAVADGKTLNTGAFKRVIDAATKAGGGTVLVPEGRWLTGAVELKTNITLELHPKAVLLLSSDPEDYPVIKTRWEGVECYNYSGLIFARDSAHVAIKGKGIIEGQGPSWWRWVKRCGPARRKLREMGETSDDAESRRFGTPEDGLRPCLIEFINCRDVSIESVTINNPPMWAIHPLYCEDVTCRDLTISGIGPNTDGIDPDSCRNVLIEKCTFDCGDDCVAIKSGRDSDGRRVNRPCEEVVIRNCTMKRGAAGVAIGSEMSGGVKNVSVSRCAMQGTTRGIRIKTMRGRGGTVEDVKIADIKMGDIVEEAIDIDMLYNPTGPRERDRTTPALSNITIGGIVCESAGHAARIRGLAESPVDGVAIRKSSFRARAGIAAENASGVTLADIELKTEGRESVLTADRSRDWTMERLKLGSAPEEDAVLTLINCRDIAVKQISAPAKTDIFLSLSGRETRGIELIDCDTSKAKQRIELRDDVPAGAVRE